VKTVDAAVRHLRGQVTAGVLRAHLQPLRSSAALSILQRLAAIGEDRRREKMEGTLHRRRTALPPSDASTIR
jgi:hypothetical protein